MSTPAHHVKAICAKHGAFRGEECPRCADVFGLLEIVEIAGKRWAKLAFAVGCRRQGDPLAFSRAMKQDADAGARFVEAVERLRESLKTRED